MHSTGKKGKGGGNFYLVRNAVRQQLELIVLLRGMAVGRLPHQLPHVPGGLGLVERESRPRRPPWPFDPEPLPQMLHRQRLEARQAAVQHAGDDVDEVLRVLACGQEGFDAELLEPAVGLGGGRVAAHDGDHFGGELEGGALELDASRGDVEAEAKVDVDDVAGLVDHDVAVVAVFELQEIRDDAVGGHGFHKIVACHLEAGRILAAVFGDEVIV